MACATSSLDIKVQNIHRFNNGQGLKAFVDIIVNEALLLKGIRVLASKRGGVFVAMPREHSAKADKWYDTIRCLTPEVQMFISQEVLKVYEETKD